jgi:hypothetical protein
MLKVWTWKLICQIWELSILCLLHYSGNLSWKYLDIVFFFWFKGEVRTQDLLMGKEH